MIKKFPKFLISKAKTNMEKICRKEIQINFHGELLVGLIPLGYFCRHTFYQDKICQMHLGIKLWTQETEWDTVLILENAEPYGPRIFTTTISNFEFIKEVKHVLARFQIYRAYRSPLILHTLTALSDVLDRELGEISASMQRYYAAKKIQDWWCGTCYYNPNHTVCQKRLLREFDLLREDFV